MTKTKEVFKEYKEAANYFLHNKLFLIIIVLVAILSFGFAITNYSIGIDDTALDRYYASDSGMLNNRWGASIIYRGLGIISFTPFWLDFIVALLIVAIAFVCCVFIKKQAKEKIPSISYIIFASILISYPLVSEAFIYQASNLTVILGNLGIIIISFLLYENFFLLKKLPIYIGIIVVLPLFISMYESTCQTFLVVLCMILLVEYVINNNHNIKIILKFFALSLLILGIAIAINSNVMQLIYIFTNSSVETNIANDKIFWGSRSIIDFLNIIRAQMVNGSSIFLAVKIFLSLCVLGIIPTLIYAIKNKKIFIIVIYLGFVLSNFSLTVLRLDEVLYRAMFSWGIFVAFTSMYIYISICNIKSLKYVAIAAFTLLIIWQTRDINQWFYKDHVRYQQEMLISYSIAEDIVKYDTSKPVIILGYPKELFPSLDPSQSNGLSVIWWGTYAFGEPGVETLKFINSLGFNFKIPTKEQIFSSVNEIREMNPWPGAGYIKETDKFILINLGLKRK